MILFCFKVFQNAGVDSFLDSVLEGYHATVFAYGRDRSVGEKVKQEGLDACDILRSKIML